MDVGKIIDRIAAAISIIVLSPLLLIIAILVKLEDGGPVLFAQARMGVNFRPFRLLKFRTMVQGAEHGPPVTCFGDSRVTRLGLFLRYYKLDELPQLFNVLAGDMRVVGARPEVPKYVERFKDQFSSILRYPPGITDPASIAFRNEESLLNCKDPEEMYVSVVLPQKLALSQDYAKRRTFFTDLRVIAKTLSAVLYGR